MQLTASQQRVLTLIHDWLRREGYPPTLRELAQHLGVCIGTIQTHLRALHGCEASLSSSTMCRLESARNVAPRLSRRT
jgi:SOS-response transcriptional repressor LexA